MIKAVIFDMYETLISLVGSSCYRSAHMAEDAGIPEEDFRNSWRMTDEDRTTGVVTVDQVIEDILKAYNCFTVEKQKTIMEKRIRYKRDVFEHMHPVQAVWYLKEGSTQPTGRMKEFTNVESPLGVIEMMQRISENRA